MRWLIVEDALRDRKGHWLEYVSTFVRELRALGDEVVVLCDRRAEGFVMEQTGARPVLPESIWHRMGDGAGAVVRYSRVPGHAIATFFAMRKVFEEFNHNRARGQMRERATGGWPEGRVSGNERVKGHRGFSHGDTANTAIEAGQCLDKPSGTAFSNPFARELVRDSENAALTRPASDPALARIVSEDRRLQIGDEGLDAGRWSLDSGEAPDWIFVPTVLVHHLLGWWMLLKAGSVPGDSRVLLFFPNLPIRLGDTGKPHWTAGPTTRLMAWLFERLRGEVENGEVVLGVETHAMRRALEGLICMPVVYLPHPVEFPAEARRRGGFLNTNRMELHERGRQGDAQGTCAGAAFSNPSTSKLARDCENTSPTRSASGTAPLPATSDPLPATSASPIVFGCYGAARWEKGSDIFQEAIRLILKNEVASGGCRVASVGPDGIKIQDSTGQDGGGLIADGSKFVPSSATGDALVSGRSTLDSSASAAGRPLRFAIQWVEDFRDWEGNLISIDPLLRDHPQVEVIGRYFEADEYERRLAQTDVMVLPYRSPYRLRVSRVVIEAMLNGMPVIATRGTTLFEQAEEYGVVVGCEAESAESLAAAMLEVAARFEMLRASAENKANAAAESFSVSYFRELLKRVGQNH